MTLEQMRRQARAGVFAAFAVAALSVAAFGAPWASAQAQEAASDAAAESVEPILENAPILIGGGVPFGLYFPLAGAICQLVDAAAGGCSVASLADSAEAITALEQARVDMALVQSDWLAHAVDGTSRFSEQGPAESLRALAALHGEGLVILVRADGDMQRPADLDGARFSRGPAESYRALLSYALIEALGLEMDDFAQVGEEGVREGLDKLCGGQVDAVAAVSAMPASVAAAAPTGCDLRFLSIPEDLAEAASEDMPGVQPMVLSPKTADGAPIGSFGLTAILTTTTDSDPEVIRRVVQALLAGVDQLQQLHPALTTISVEGLARAGRHAPLHEAVEPLYQAQ
jgi:TRAP transporter TAXI family solute receptor